MRGAIDNLKMVMPARNTFLLVRSARTRLHAQRRCVAGPLVTVNVRPNNTGVNIMATKVRIQLGFQRYTDQQLASLAAAVIKGMTGNKAFPNPPVDLTAAQTALDDYNAALAATILGGPAATATKNAKRDVLTGILEKL